MFIIKRHVYKSCHENIFSVISKNNNFYFLKIFQMTWNFVYLFIIHVWTFKTFMDEFSFLLFEKYMRKKIHIKIWICKTICCKHDLQSLTQLATIKCGRWLAKTLRCLLKNYNSYNRPYVCCLHTNSMTICWINLFAPSSNLSLKGILNLLSNLVNLPPFHSINVSEIPNVLRHISY